MNIDYLKTIDQKKIKILKFLLRNEKIVKISDYSFIKEKEYICLTLITDLLYLHYKEKKYFISLNETNKIYIICLNNNKLIHKIVVPFSKNETKFSVICIKDITNNIEKRESLINFVIGTSNGLLYFYSVDINILNNINEILIGDSCGINSFLKINESIDITSPSELKGIFSTFLNQFFNIKEIKLKIKSEVEILHENKNKLEILLEDFLNKNAAKDHEPIYFINTRNKNLFAGLNSFVFKYNLNLNLLTQVLPISAATNDITLDNDNIYVSTNSRFLLLFESRGILISKIDTSLSSIFKMEKIFIKNKEVYLIIFLNF